MFVDASALVAMLGRDETRARALATRLQGAATRLTAPTAVAETVGRLVAETGLDAPAVHDLVRRFLDAAGVKLAALPPGLAAAAADVFAHAGATAARPAGLTMEKCLTVAAAAYYRLPLLHDDPRFDRVAPPGG